jgi:NAD(P)-dependent dehydrogenase (short-subunit alcohol dehydrogenase family)
MRVHLRGHFCTSRHAAEYWRAQAKAGTPVDARIINTTSGAGLQGSVGQSAYSTAKAGIAGLTLVQAAEMGLLGVTANALAPNARTRMTDTGAFDMGAQEGAFDVFAPENMAPLVAYLVSEQSRGVTGQVFELKGGTIFLSQGWTDSQAYEKGERFDAAELDPVVRKLIAEREPAKPVYGAA